MWLPRAFIEKSKLILTVVVRFRQREIYCALSQKIGLAFFYLSFCMVSPKIIDFKEFLKAHSFLDINRKHATYNILYLLRHGLTVKDKRLIFDIVKHIDWALSSPWQARAQPLHGSIQLFLIVEH